MPKVYVSLKYDVFEGNKKEFLGVFANKEDAKARCESERTFTRDGWRLDDSKTDVWSNGYGLKVLIEEYEI